MHTPTTPWSHARDGELWRCLTCGSYSIPHACPLGPAFLDVGAPGARHDAHDVLAYVREHSGHVPARQLDAFVGYWVTRQSVATMADLEGLSRATVKKRILRLRRRVRRWVARQRPQRTR